MFCINLRVANNFLTSLGGSKEIFNIPSEMNFEVNLIFSSLLFSHFEKNALFLFSLLIPNVLEWTKAKYF